MCSLFHITLLYFPWFLNRVHHTHSNSQQIRHAFSAVQSVQYSDYSRRGAQESLFEPHPCDHYNLSHTQVYSTPLL
jgi:hypothetical protein